MTSAATLQEGRACVLCSCIETELRQSILRPYPHLFVFKSLILPKTLQNIFPHPSVFVSFSPVHTITLGNNENDLELGCAYADAPIWTETYVVSFPPQQTFMLQN